MVLKKCYDETLKQYYFEDIIVTTLTNTNRSPVYELVLEKGVYYIGYFDSLEGKEIDINNTLKADPSIVYKKELTILKETSNSQLIIESNLTYSYKKENGTYKLALSDDNSPYPWIQYYEWDIVIEDIDKENGLIVGMDYFGFITANKPGRVRVRGYYTLNHRIVLEIQLNIVE